MTRLYMCFVLLVVATATAEEPRTWVGPRIDSINTLGGGTLLDVVDQIRAEIQKDKDSSISVRIDVSDDDLRKVSGEMALRKIPTIVALSYVASIGVFEFAFENGVWVLRNTPMHERRYPDDIVTVRCEPVTKDELQSLGLTESKDGTIEVQAGKKWPTEKWGKIRRIDDVVILRAYRREIDCFDALLSLNRCGYRVPAINSTHDLGLRWSSEVWKFGPPNHDSEQDGADQPATAPESKSEGNEKPKPESEGRSQ